ncbi:hypothetical protein NDU88_001706 [Pleurodeles waltl]|uniref:Uncharacterized protein n=1 Tax=Pleurodeles waltl TaxID=8319 RepID=A0AAV7LDX6_PLEWA|nr:hypothetical protein NDU88_001706 [Pleurodeles waltl]
MQEREFQLQLARLRLERKKAERAAETEQAEAERALAEKKLLLAHELSLKELDVKARQPESSSDAGSITVGPAEDKKESRKLQEEQVPLPPQKRVQKKSPQLDEDCRNAPKEDISRFLCDAMDVPRRDVGCRRVWSWIHSTSLGSGKVAFCVKMALSVLWRDLGASTLCEEEEGALSTSESPQSTREHPRESQDTGTKEVQNAVGAARQRKVPSRRRSTQRVEHRRMEC